MRSYVLSFCLSLIALAGVAQNIKFKTYTVEHGLSNNSVNQIINDPSGGLWIATWDGLNFFDGKSFQVFKHDPRNSQSLPGNYIYGLFTDQSGTLWVQSSLTTVSKQTAFGEFENYSFEQEIEDFGMNRDQLVALRVGGAHYVYADSRFVPGTDSDRIQTGTIAYDKVIQKHFPDIQLKDQLRDNQGNLWFASTTTGLFILPFNEDDREQDSFHNYTVDASDPYSLRSNEVYALHEDVFGNIWLGLKDGGLSMAYKNSHNIHAISPHSKRFSELPLETIRAIHQDQSGNLLLGFYNSGVYRYDPEQQKFKEISVQPAKSNSDWKRVRSLFLDSQGSVWVGTYAGLIQVTAGGAMNYYPGGGTPHLSNGRNYDIMEDTEENCLWIACWGGLSKFSLDAQRFVPFEAQEKLKDYHIRKIAKSNDALWLATENNGVIRVEGSNLEFLTYAQGLLDNSVYSLLPDNQTGDLWIGTLGGVTIYRPGVGILRQITEKNGLFSQLAYGLLAGDKHVWVSTTKGIAAIDKESFEVTALPPGEGWQSGEFSEGAYYKSERGTLFFAGVKGLNYFHPKALDLSFDPPKIHLRPVQNQAGFDVKYPTSLKVDVQAIQFTANPYNRILYRLEPLETEWKTVDPTFTILYENLPPGKYRLLAKNESDTADLQVASLFVDIPMPFWKSSFFWIVLLSAVFLIFIRWRHLHNRRQRVKLQLLIDERTKTIEEQKEKLMEINTSLDQKNREISVQKAQLLEYHNQQKNPDFEIEKFKKFVLNQFGPPLAHIKKDIDTGRLGQKEVQEDVAIHINALIRELRDWEKLSVLDHLEESTPSLTVLSSLYESLTFELRGQLKARQIQLTYDYHLGDEWVSMDVLRVKLFFHCLFRELIKFMENHSQLTIEASVSNQTVCIHTRSNSHILTANFQQIMDGSLYMRSAQRILADLGGRMDFVVEGSVSLKVCIPFVFAENPHGTLTWDSFEMEDRVVSDRFNVVILGTRFETDGMVKLLAHERVNLIEEENPLKLVSLVQHSAIDALILYNAKISQPILDLMQSVKESNDSIMALPVLYFYELLEYGLQEKLADLGVGTFIQLPSSLEYIKKKLHGLIQTRRRYLEERKQHSLIPLSHKDSQDDHLTPNERLIREALQIIKQKYADPNFRVESLSSTLGISKIKCYRLFKEVLDTSPSDLIIKLRLQKAEQLLQKKKMNISEVGFECGFNDPKYFSKLFKKHYGASPRGFA